MIDWLDRRILSRAVGIWHASRSCRMGHDHDPMAVVDTAGWVREECTIFGYAIRPCFRPFRPWTPISVPMTAEKIAAAILDGR